MSLAAYAGQVIEYLHDQGFEYAAPDSKGGTFPGGILMDLGGGQRVAFFLPVDDVRVAVRNLKGYLEEVYPGAHTVEWPVNSRGLLRSHVHIEQLTNGAAA